MKSLILTLVSISTLYLGAQNATLSGKIDNPNSDYISIYVEYYDGRDNVLLDSVELKNGSFSSNFKLDSLTSITLYDGMEYTSFFMNSGEKASFYVNSLIFDESLVFYGDGAERNNYLTSYQRARFLFKSNLSNISPDVDFSDTTRLFEDLEKKKGVLQKNLDFGFNKFPELQIAISRRKHNLERSYKMSKYRKKFEIELHHLSKRITGEDFMDFEAVNLNGKTMSLKDFKGKPIIVDFWATWCGPCKKEMPYLKEIEEEFKGKINILSINCWDKKEKWEAQAEEFNALNSLFFTKESFTPMTKEYVIRYIPRFMLLDKNGKIIDISAKRPSAGLKKQIEELLEN